MGSTACCSKMAAMDVDADLTCTSPPDRVFEIVSDLGTYPEWLDIVTRAEAVPAAAGDDDGDGTSEESGDGAAWSVDLTGQVGPLRRTKRLRMVRTRSEPGHHVRFERREVDDRQHSAWVLSATLEPVDVGTTLTMRLHYDGRLWMPILDRLLAQEIERSRTRLAALLGENTTP